MEPAKDIESTFLVIAETDDFAPDIKRGDTLLIDREMEPKPGNLVIMIEDGACNLSFYWADTIYKTDAIKGVLTQSTRIYRG